MLVVHHLENSQSIRILWLLEELGEGYEIKHYARVGPNTLAPESYKSLHPIGTSPTITDGDLVLPETNAIVEHLLDRHPGHPLRPKIGSPERTRYLYWFHASQASFMPLLVDALVFKRMISRTPALMRWPVRMVVERVRSGLLDPRIKRHFDYMESTLREHTWLAGDLLTAADIVMGYCLEVAQVRIGIPEDCEAIAAYIQRMKERPAYKRALEKNGPFKPLAE